MFIVAPVERMLKAIMGERKVGSQWQEIWIGKHLQQIGQVYGIMEVDQRRGTEIGFIQSCGS
jgi:hypothetical protein